MIWTLAAGGADAPGETLGRHAARRPLPSAATAARAGRWSSALWSQPERAEWFGGGYDHPGIHSILVDPRDPARLTVGISCGGVWKSDDRGASWRLAGQGLRAAYMPPERAYDPNIQDPHLIAACAAAPDAVWCQHHNGMFRSTDGGATFAEIDPPPPSGFGFAVAPHPGRPADRLVRAGGQGRVPGAGGRPARGHAHPRRRRELRDAGRRACRRARATTSIYRHALVVDAPARGSPWARPPATSGSATAPARPGRRWPATCRRSPRSPSPDGASGRARRAVARHPERRRRCAPRTSASGSDITGRRPGSRRRARRCACRLATRLA